MLTPKLDQIPKTTIDGVEQLLEKRFGEMPDSSAPLNKQLSDAMARKSREADTIRDLRVQIANDKESKKKTKKTAGEDVVEALEAAELGAPVVEAIHTNHHQQFIERGLLQDVWEIASQAQPQFLHKRGQPMKSQPKLIYGIANDKGELPLFRLANLDKKDYTQILPMPEIFKTVAGMIKKRFGTEVNHCLANYMPNGSEHYVPMHQDQAFSDGASKVEKMESVFIVALGSFRPLVFAGLEDMGKKTRKELQHFKTEVPSKHGDLFLLTGDANSNMTHGILKDSGVSDLRISLTFRRVEHSRVHPEEAYFIGPSGRKQSLPKK